MKFKNDVELQKLVDEYLAFEKAMINNIPDGVKWDIADSLVLSDCDCLISLAEAPKEDQDPLYCPLEFGLDDNFASFETLMERQRKIGTNYPVHYFVYESLMILFVGDYGTIRVRLDKMKEKTAMYYAEQMYARLTKEAAAS